MNLKLKIIKKFLKDLILKIHFFIFKKEPGEFAKRLLRNLFFAFFGVGGATIITFFFYISAVRFLGPLEYGKVNLIVSVGEFLAIPILWGFSVATLRYLGAEREKQQEIIGSAFRIVFFLGLFFSILFLFIGPFFQQIIKIPNYLYNLAILYAIVSAFFYLFQSFFQGLEKFKKFSFLWIFSAFIFAGLVFLFLFYFKNHSFESLFFSSIIRLLIIIITGTFIFRKFLLKFNYNIAKKLFYYGSYQTICSIFGFFSFGNINNLMINYYLGPAMVGLYSAYYVVFNTFISKVLNTFSQVFLPIASGYQDVQELFNRTIIFFKKIGWFFLIGSFFLIWLLFQFYGKNFTFDWRLALLISLSITLYIFLMVLGNIIASTGIKGAKIGTFFAFSSAIINIVLNVILIPRFQLFGAVIGTIITTIILLVIVIYFLKTKFIYNER